MHLIDRKHYLDATLAYRDKGLVSVITGLRQCGKSSLLALIADHLLNDGIAPDRIISLNLDSPELHSISSASDLHDCITTRIAGVQHPSILIDEVQRVHQWADVLSTLCTDVDCDFYVTGSNAFVFPDESAANYPGRFVEIKMFPLTFAEFLNFRGLEWFSAENAQSDLATDGQIFHTLARLFEEYRHFGGMPHLASSEIDHEQHRRYTESLYRSIVTKDIIERAETRPQRSLSNPDLLKRLCLFYADAIGFSSSFHQIAMTLKTEKTYTAPATVEAYTDALIDACLFYPVPRFDIKSGSHLKTLGKHYIVDTGLRNYLLGYKETSQGRVLEDIVYLQLLFNGFDVTIGKIGQDEINFVATKPQRKLYIQVSKDMSNPQTQEQELMPLKRVKDSYPKYVIVGKGSYPVDINGIRIVQLIDFLLGRTDRELL